MAKKRGMSRRRTMAGMRCRCPKGYKLVVRGGYINCVKRGGKKREPICRDRKKNGTYGRWVDYEVR